MRKTLAKIVNWLLAAPEQTDEASPRALKRLELQLSELRDELADARREFKSIRLEWEESYDKLHHLMARITKRSKIASPEPPEAPGDTNGSAPSLPPMGSHGHLQELRARYGGRKL